MAADFEEFSRYRPIRHRIPLKPKFTCVEHDLLHKRQPQPDGDTFRERNDARFSGFPRFNDPDLVKIVREP